VSAFGWPELLALLTSVGFGVVSAVFPVANAEAYVIASQVSAVAGPIHIAIGVAIGQTVGKSLLFLAVREGKDSRFIRHRRNEHPTKPAGRFRAGFRSVLATLLALVGQERWGLPIVGLASVVGLPPLYAVALLAGATRMRLTWFAAVVLLGRSVRFVLVALGVGVIDLW
jgi:membrane protein YqaA with SNARE-associated domain